MRFDNEPEFKQRAHLSVVRLQVLTVFIFVLFVCKILKTLVLNLMCVNMGFRVEKRFIARHGNGSVTLARLNLKRCISALGLYWRQR